MVLDWLMNLVGSALDKFISHLPGWSVSWPIAENLRALGERITLVWNLFPPLRTGLEVLAAGLAVETILILWYWINWLIKKIPGIG